MTEIQTTSEITVELFNSTGDDLMIVQAARVSTVGEACQESEPGQHAGLINYLMKHRHGTPFEHNSITFFVKAPIFVWREWHRHRIGFSYNEESARYKVLEPLFYLPEADRPMFKVDGWKPGRPKFTSACSDAEDDKVHVLKGNLRYVYESAYRAYLENLDLGIDPGLARDCLPVGIYSSCWVTCNARSLMSFLSLRTHEPEADRVSYPLYEIEVAARKCEEHFAKLFPLTYQAWTTNGRIAP